MTNNLIHQLTNEYRGWFAAIGAEGIGPLDSMLAEDWMYTNYDGLVRSKSEYLEWVAEVTESAVFVGPYDVQVVERGDVVLVLGGYRVLDPSSDDVLELRFTGVWVLSDARWQCLVHHNSQVTA